MSLIRQIFSTQMLLCFMLGISSGIPLLATGSTLKAWLVSVNVDLSTIGLFALTGLPYTLKFLWAPLIDYYAPLGLTRRRGWMLVTQCALIALFICIGLVGPSLSLVLLAGLVLLTCFASATQDIVLDAYRRDILADNELGLGSSLFINGYRVGMILSGALALALADLVPWPIVYYCIAGSMLIGVFTSLFASEPVQVKRPATLTQSIIGPLRDFFSKADAYLILVFILLYKLGDSMASEMTTPFILMVDFSKTDLAVIAKGLGMAATLGGALLAGLLMLRIGINKALWIFGLLQAVSTTCFIFLVYFPGDKSVLSAVVTFEYLASGMGTAAFAAFIASMTNRTFSATQYALLSSLLGVPRVIFGSTTGFLASYFGWANFFLLCTVAAIPGMLLLLRVAPWNDKRQTSS